MRSITIRYRYLDPPRPHVWLEAYIVCQHLKGIISANKHQYIILDGAKGPLGSKYRAQP